MLEPECLVLDEENIVVGALDSITGKIIVCADKAIAYRIPFEQGKVYQIKRSGKPLLRVKLIRTTNPYSISEDIFIYNDIRFLCV